MKMPTLSSFRFSTFYSLSLSTPSPPIVHPPASYTMNIVRSTTKVFPNNYRGVFSQIRNRRDQLKREAAADTEIQRRAYLYIARNTSLPPTVRYKAQLGLNALHEKAPGATNVKNRCTETGRGRGVLSKFGLCRVRIAGEKGGDSIAELC
jgi:small subunit ribosomal protein S14